MVDKPQTASTRSTHPQEAVMQDTAKVNNRQATSAFQSDNTFNERNNYETDVTSEGINIAAIKAHNHNDDEQPQMQTTSPSTDNTTFSSWENQIENYDQDHENQHLPEGSAVPSGRIARAFGFASLGTRLAMGTVAELARRTLGNSNNNDPLVLSNDANAQRLSNSLRRMRGAAMKLGQMLSIQDKSIPPPALINTLAHVRKGLRQCSHSIN